MEEWLEKRDGQARHDWLNGLARGDVVVYGSNYFSSAHPLQGPSRTCVIYPPLPQCTVLCTVSLRWCWCIHMSPGLESRSRFLEDAYASCWPYFSSLHFTLPCDVVTVQEQVMRINRQLWHVRVLTLSDDITRDRHIMSCFVNTVQYNAPQHNITQHNNISLDKIKSHATMHVTCVQMAGCMQRMVIEMCASVLYRSHILLLHTFQWS